MRDRYSCRRRCSHSGGDTRHHLARNAVSSERERFLAATAEYERIATLQPYDALAFMH